ncbi:MAG: HYR domain-containing protein [Saprospiraceae bacterium]
MRFKISSTPPFLTAILLFLVAFVCRPAAAQDRAREGAFAALDPTVHFWESTHLPHSDPASVFSYTGPVVSSAEDAAVLDVLRRFVPSGVAVSGLQLISTGDGGKVASGNISLFGSDAVQLEALLGASLNVQSVTLNFPASLSFSLDKLSSFLGGASLSNRLPSGFPASTGLSIQSMGLEFDETGGNLANFNVTIGVSSYAIPGFSAVAISGITLSLNAINPTRSDRALSGTITGAGRIGTIPVALSATLSTNPADIEFTGTAQNISVETVVNSFASGAEAQNLLQLVPSVFKSLEFSTLTASFFPASLSFSGLGVTNLGSVEMKFMGVSSGGTPGLQLGVAPPATFQFSQIHSSMAPLDGIDLNGTAIIISSVPDTEITSRLPGMENEEGGLVRGLNMFTSIDFNPKMASFTKINRLRIRGTLEPNVPKVSLDAAVEFDLPFPPDKEIEQAYVVLKRILFGLDMSSTNPLQFNIGGQLEVRAGQDRLRFQAGFGFRPLALQFEGEFFMEAIEKSNGTVQNATIGSDGKPVPPEWTEPFGIRGLGLRNLGVAAGVDLNLHLIYLNKLGFLGSARFGTNTDRSKHLDGALTTSVNITNPMNSIVDVEVKNATILGMMQAYDLDRKIPTLLRPILNPMLRSGFDSARVKIVPVSGLEQFGKTYERGIAFGGKFSLLGLGAYLDFSLSESGVSAGGGIDPIDWGPFKLTGYQSPRPQLSLGIGTKSHLFIDGQISLLGMSSATQIYFNEAGFEFTTTGKLFDKFEVTLEAKGVSFIKDSAGIYVRGVLRNDLIQYLNEELTKGLDQATKATQTALSKARRDLEAKRASYREVEVRFNQRMAEVTSRREADLRKMRDEARRAQAESKRVMDRHRKKIREINVKLSNLNPKRVLDLPDIAVQEAAKKSHEAALAAEKIIYDGYSKTVNGLADIGDDFPKEIEGTDLAIDYAAKYAAVETAIAAVDAVKGASDFGLDAAQWIVDNTLNGAVEIKSVEFEGSYALKTDRKIVVRSNVIITQQPYHFDIEIDFDDIPGSAQKIANEMVKGNLWKPGFAPTFADQLKAPVSNVPLTTAAGGMNYNQIPTAVPVHYYFVTVDIPDTTDAGSTDRFDVTLNGSSGALTRKPLSKDLFGAFAPNSREVFTITSSRDIGAIQSIQISPTGSLTDNLRVKGIGVQTSYAPGSLYGECTNCEISSTSGPKTISFDGKSYADYRVAISTMDGINAGTDENVSITLVGTRGKSPKIRLNPLVTRNAFERNNVDEVPISIEDIGPIQRVIMEVKPKVAVFPDHWGFSGITLLGADGTIKTNYCNCDLSDTSLNLVLEDPRVYTTYQLNVFTGKDGTDGDVFLQLVGSNGAVSPEYPLRKILRSKKNFLGGENLFNDNGHDWGSITVKNMPCVSKIRLRHASRNILGIVITDDWGMKKVVLINSTQAITTTNASDVVFYDSTININTGVKNTELLLSCPPDIRVQTTAGQCTAVVNYAFPRSSDYCNKWDASRISGQASGTAFPLGLTVNTFEVSDRSGHRGSCSFEVLVEDKQAPQISCPANKTVPNDSGSCGAKVTYAASASDNCTSNVPVYFAPVSGSFFESGTTTVRCVATDAAGNEAACSFTVTVQDQEAPQISCPENVTLSTDPGQCSAVFTFQAPVGTDNCAGATTVQTRGLASGSPFPGYVTGITEIIGFKVTDAGGKTASCSFTVLVYDTEPAKFSCPPDIQINTDPGQCTAVVNYTMPNVTDNCTIRSRPNLSAGEASGSAFSLGRTEVAYVLNNEIEKYTCSFYVTVTDREKPRISCPANSTVSTDPLECSARIQPQVTAGDNCAEPVSIRSDKAAGSPFPLGTTTVTSIATDGSRNTASCTYTVTVRDTKPPAINCPADVTVNTEQDKCTAVVRYDAPEVFDNCSIDATTQLHGLASGTAFPKGQTLNEFQTRDGAGLTASCSFTVTVNDVQKPVIRCSENKTVNNDPGNCSARVNFASTATDNCTSAVSIAHSIVSGSVFPVGTTIITGIATDESDNTSSCTFSITVNDLGLPSISCPANLTQSCEVSTLPETVGNPSPADNCGVADVKYSDIRIDGNCPGNYTLRRTWTVADIHTNSNTCQQVITVHDRKAPVITCPETLTVTCDINPATSTGEAYAIDNCDAVPHISFSDQTTSGACEWLCTIERTWLAVDNCGNSVTCMQVVTKNTLPLIEEALRKDLDGDGRSDTLVIGHNTVKVILPPGMGACVQQWLPTTGTTAAALRPESYLVTADCRPGANALDANGKLSNPLLAQAIKLNIMLRLKPDLATVKLTAVNCSLPPVVRMALAPDPDVQELVRVTNFVLGNNGPIKGPDLNQLLSVLQCVNGYSDVCE